MKNVLVVGWEEALKEFQALPIENAKVDFVDQIDVDAYHIMEQFELEEEELGFDLMEGEDVMPDILGDEVMEQYDVVFDLSLDDNPENLLYYASHPHLTVIGRAVKHSLAEMAFELLEELECTFIGVNTLPTFINRPRMELSVYHDEDKLKLANLMKEFGLPFDIVADRVGMVTPRIIFMLINEACYVLGEGTADIEAVDNAMKLGTNYPHGPFEWADAIGIRHVYHTLLRIGEDTGESKYKVAPLLKRKFLKGEQFYM